MELKQIFITLDVLFADYFSFDDFLVNMPNSALHKLNDCLFQFAAIDNNTAADVPIKALGYDCDEKIMLSHCTKYFLKLDSPQVASALEKAGSEQNYLLFYGRMLQYLILEMKARYDKSIIPVGACQLHVDPLKVFQFKTAETIQRQRQHQMELLVQTEKANVLTEMWLEKIKVPKV